MDDCIRAGNTPFLASIRETMRQYSKLIKKITNQVDGGLAMDIKDFLLKDSNLKIIDEVTKVIPYAKAEIEFNFWYKLYEKYNKSIQDLGYKFIEDDNFPMNKSNKTKLWTYTLKKLYHKIPFLQTTLRKYIGVANNNFQFMFATPMCYCLKNLL